MDIHEERILKKVCDRLSAERIDSSIVYLDRNLKRVSQSLHVGDVVIEMPWDGYIAFVDLEPGVNWGHLCFYLAIPLDDNEVIEYAAQMPPFLKTETSSFHLLWRGIRAPEWAVVITPT